MKVSKCVQINNRLSFTPVFTWVLLVWLVASAFCSCPLPSLSALLSPSLHCVWGLRPAGRCVWGALPLATVDLTACVSLSTGDAASLVVLGGRTMVRLALGSWGCCSPFVTITGLLVVAEPSPAPPFTPTESVVALSHTDLFFMQRLTDRSALLPLRRNSLCAGEEGGWGWSFGCEGDGLGLSDEPKATGFISSSLSFLVSVGTASFSFLFDWSRVHRRKNFFII